MYFTCLRCVRSSSCFQHVFFGTALLYILSCSFPVSILDKRVPGVYALR